MTAVDRVIAIASSELGKPYAYGDEGPNSFDCSGLIQYVFAQVGIHLPRTAADQQAATARVSTPLPGDLVFFGQPATHVGLYIGAGKMISAPAPGEKVHVVGVGTPTNYGRVSGLGTLLAPVVGTVSDTTSAALGITTDWLGSVRYVALEAVAVAFGLALVGVGLWRAAKPLRDSATSTLEGVL